MKYCVQGCIAFCLLLVFPLCFVAAEEEARGVGVEEAFPNLRFHRPVFLTYSPDGRDRLFVVEQSGRVLWFENRRGVEKVNVSVDMRGSVGRRNNEEGLLGFAFHPAFQANGRVYLHYTAGRGRRRNVLAEFVMDGAREKIDLTTRRVIMKVDQPWWNHNGGMIGFGPDGYLYVSLGDGGAGGDPKGNGQNLGTLLGSILRIDVDRADPGLRYGVPADNPFVGLAGARGEIWAYGLRNVWRFSFDRERGDLWAGDVGQDLWEEIDLIEKGGNYGWNVREGKHGFRGNVDGPFEEPVVEHGRGEARSITGGYVYRGERLAWLRGAYVYGDYATGLVWALRYEGGRVTDHRYLCRVGSLSSFGEDRDGELYLVSLEGRVYRLVDRSGSVEEGESQK